MCKAEPKNSPDLLQGELRRIQLELTSGIREDLDKVT
jgi:hypothetical protein